MKATRRRYQTRQYVSGESFRYLGRQYRLKVIEADTEGVRLYRGRLEVSVKAKQRARVQKLVTACFRARAETVFQERYEICTQAVKVFDLHHDLGFELRSMVKRWGSLTKEGKLILNPQLVSAPKACIDYVVTHELCHLKERNHSRRFYTLLSRCLPDWQDKRRELNSKVEVALTMEALQLP